jgi:hypothetical protein
LAQLPNLPRQLNSSHVLVRFGVRVIILASFAAFSSTGFGRSLAALLWMAIIFCTVMGAIRREPVFQGDLNHWDEAAAYGALFALIHEFEPHLAS